MQRRVAKFQALGLCLATVVGVGCGNEIDEDRQVTHQVGRVAGVFAHLLPAARLDDTVELLDHTGQRGPAVHVPAPGQGVWAETYGKDGVTRQIRVVTDDQGIATVYDDNEVEQVAQPVRDGSFVIAVAENPCTDDDYTTLGWVWDEAFEWSFNSGTTPSGLTTTNATNKLRAAMINDTRGDNSCGLADNIDATSAYLGPTTQPDDINATATCQAFSATDDENVVTFGNLPAGVLAATCTWFSGSDALQSDVRVNSDDFDWYPGGACDPGEYNLEAVMTHEFGHTFGLGHVSEGAHGKLTMSTASNGPCQNSESTLGYGDVLGMESLY
jgi:matrixin